MKEIDDILKQTEELRRVTEQAITNIESLVKSLNLSMYYVDGEASVSICETKVADILRGDK